MISLSLAWERSQYSCLLRMHLSKCPTNHTKKYPHVASPKFLRDASYMLHLISKCFGILSSCINEYIYSLREMVWIKKFMFLSSCPNFIWVSLNQSLFFVCQVFQMIKVMITIIGFLSCGLHPRLEILYRLIKVVWLRCMCNKDFNHVQNCNVWLQLKNMCGQVSNSSL